MPSIANENSCLFYFINFGGVNLQTPRSSPTEVDLHVDHNDSAQNYVPRINVAPGNM